MQPKKSLQNWDDILHELQNLAEKYPAAADDILRIVEKIAAAAGVD